MNKLKNFYESNPKKISIIIAISILFIFFILVGIITSTYNDNNNKLTNNINNTEAIQQNNINISTDEILTELNTEFQGFNEYKDKEISLSQFPVWGNSDEKNLKQLIELIHKNYTIKKDSIKFNKEENSSYELEFKMSSDDSNVIFEVELNYDISAKMFKINSLKGKFE